MPYYQDEAEAAVAIRSPARRNMGPKIHPNKIAPDKCKGSHRGICQGTMMPSAEKDQQSAQNRVRQTSQLKSVNHTDSNLPKGTPAPNSRVAKNTITIQPHSRFLRIFSFPRGSLN